MPHLSIEYSANLDGQVDMTRLCRALLETLIGTGLFEAAAPRVRAFPATAYAIADQLPENAFIDMSLRMGVGRSQEDRRAVGDALVARASEELAGLLVGQHFALSLEIREIDPNLSWKKNSMHARLRANH